MMVGVCLQCDEHIDKGLALGSTFLSGERLGIGQGLDDVPGHEVHDVERRAVDVVVGAQPERGCDRNVGRSERRDDPVLAPHVVRRGEDLAERRAPEHPVPTGLVANAIRQVRMTAGDQVEFEWWRDTVDVRFEPGRDPVAVDPFRSAQGATR